MKPSKLLIFGVLLFAFTFSIYAYSAARYPTGHADSDEILTVSYLNGVAHPSGYPLQILLTGNFIRHLPIENKALAGNLSASLSQALSITLLYGIGILTFLIATHKKHINQFQLLLAAIASTAGALIIAFSGLFWIYGSVIEVMSLNNALIAATVFSAFLWWYRSIHQKPAYAPFLFTFLLAGLSLAHVHTSVLMLPALLLILFLNRQQLFKPPHKPHLILGIGGILLLVLGFLLPQLLSHYHNLQQPQLSWYFTPTLEGLIHLITRQDYTGYFFDDNQTRAAYLFGFTDRFFNVHQAYLQYLWQHTSVIGLLLGLFGIYWFYKSSRRVFSVIFLLWLVAGPIFNSYMGYPKFDPTSLEYFMEVGITQRQFLVSHMFFGLFIIWGLLGIYQLIYRKSNAKVALSIAVLIAVSSVAWVIFDNYHVGIQRQNNLVSTYAHQALDAVEPDAVIICSADVSCFSLVYATIVEGYRSDVTVLTKNSLLRKHYLNNHPEYFPFSYHDNPYFYANLLAWNVAHQPVYLTNPSTSYIDYIGMDANPFYLVPTNYLFKVVPKVPSDPLPKPYYEFTTKLLNPIPPTKDAYMYGLLDYFSSFHNTAGVLYANFSYPNFAKTNYELSLGLNPNHPDSQKWLSNVDNYEGNPAYAPNSFVDLESFFQQADALLQENQIEKAYEVVRKASYLDPTNPNIRFAMANIYILGGYTQEALTELDHVLLFNPDHQPTIELRRSIISSQSAELVNPTH